MKKIIISIFCCLCMNAYSLDKAPWFGDVYEFHFLGRYTYSHYNQVNGAIYPLDYSANNHLLLFNLSFSPSLQWSIDSDLEFSASPLQNFGFCSVAFQGRTLLKDDIIGDPISLALGADVRVVSSESLKDVNNLYHSNLEFEFNLAFGKEFSRLDCWSFRFWGFGLIGIANRGSPWLKGEFALEGNVNEQKKWAVFANAMKTFGSKENFNIYDFNGYAKIRQQNLDLGFRYGWKLGVWGTFSLEYKRRLIAKRCPKNENFLTASYVLPFSF